MVRELLSALSISLSLAVVGSVCGGVVGLGCSTPAPPNPVRRHDARVSRLNETLVYDGELTLDGLEALRREDDGLATTLLVRSPGGSVDVGMDFGDFVHERGLAVVVQGYCNSSCANYLFLGAPRKAILPAAVVAWHGSARQGDFETQLQKSIDSMKLPPEEAKKLHEQGETYLRAMIRRQDAFFARIGVNECITRVGNEHFGSPGLFTMSPSDMERFGVRGLLAGPTSEDEIPPELRARMHLVFVKLEADIDLAHACRY